MQEVSQKIIFHIPNFINKKCLSASQARPLLMLKAFQSLGYEVDVIMGYGQERKKSIEAIKRKLSNNVKYDFLYSESSTMPTLLTEKHHLPIYPFLDFDFFKITKKMGIPIGLFYRDLHWRFEQYKMRVPWYKQVLALPFYKYDSLQYEKYIDCIFVPSSKMIKFIDKKLTNKAFPLPPGCEIYETNAGNKKVSVPNDTLQLLYVGGIVPPVYNLAPMFEWIEGLSHVQLTLICRENEWKHMSDKYNNQLANIEVVHTSGEHLNIFYNRSDIFAMLWDGSNPYLKFATPFKLFESLGYGLPIITTKGTESSRFVEQEGLGWIVSNKKEFYDLINYLQIHREKIEIVKERIKKIRNHHTWKARARKVAEVLLQI